MHRQLDLLCISIRTKKKKTFSANDFPSATVHIF